MTRVYALTVLMVPFSQPQGRYRLILYVVFGDGDGNLPYAAVNTFRLTIVDDKSPNGSLRRVKESAFQGSGRVTRDSENAIHRTARRGTSVRMVDLTGRCSNRRQPVTR